MRRATMGLLAAAGALVLAASASAATVTFLGSEITTSTSGTWQDGNRTSWLTTGVGYAKAYDADGNDVYGSDGYVLYNQAPADGRGGPYGFSITTGTVVAPDYKTVTGIASYVSSIAVTAGVPSSAIAGGGDIVQDPTNPAQNVGFGAISRRWDAEDADAISDFLDITVDSAATFNIGFIVGRGDNQKPGAIMLGGATALRAGNAVNNYERPDWYFFSVTTTGPEVLTLQVQRNGTNGQSNIDGIVFDSAVPEPASLGLLSLGGLALLRRRR